MHFAHPLFLLLLLALPLLLWRLLRQRHAAVRFPGAAELRPLPAGRAWLARRGGVALRVLAVALLVVALAGPRWPDEGSKIPTQGVSVGLVLDVSGSMGEEDFFWGGEQLSRLEAVKKVFRLFVAGGDQDGRAFPGRGNDLVGLTVFATRPETVCPLTLSHDVLLGLLDEQEPRTVPTEARTNIGDALAWALQRLEATGQGDKALLLFTDGEHNVPPPALTPRQAAQLAGNLQVPVYVIDAGKGLGSDREGDKDSAGNRERARAQLQEVAKISGGKYFAADNTEALLEVARDIDGLTRARIETFEYRRHHEGFVWFALAAFGLLAAVLALERTVWRVVP